MTTEDFEEIAQPAPVPAQRWSWPAFSASVFILGCNLAESAATWLEDVAGMLAAHATAKQRSVDAIEQFKKELDAALPVE